MDFCYNELRIRQFNLVGFVEDYHGEKRLYRCDSCGITQENTGLEFEVDNHTIWVKEPDSDTPESSQEALQ